MKKVLWFIVVLVIAAIIYGLTQWYKPHRDILGEEAVFKMKATELVTAFQEHEATANTKYVDQVVILEGEIEEVASDHIKFKGGVYADGDFSAKDLQSGAQVKVKGRVISYDEIFEEVKLDNAVVAE